MRGEDFNEDLDADSDRTLDTETESDEDLMSSKVEAWRATNLAKDDTRFAFCFWDFDQAYYSACRYVALAWSWMQL